MGCCSSNNKISTYNEQGGNDPAVDAGAVTISRTDGDQTVTSFDGSKEAESANNGNKEEIKGFDDANLTLDEQDITTFQEPTTPMQSKTIASAQSKIDKRLKKQEETERKKREEIEKKQRAKEEAELQKIAKKQQKEERKPMHHRESSGAVVMDGTQYVYFDDDDKKDIKATNQIFGQFFSLEEMRRMYARFKENGKHIARSDFNMIFALYGRNVDTTMASRVFDLFDMKHVGHLNFTDFVHFMAVVQKGTPRQKMEYCFRLFDRDGDGSITRDDITEILSQMPVQKMVARRERNMEQFMRRRSKLNVSLDSVEEDEESSITEDQINQRERAYVEAESQARQRAEEQKAKEQLVRELRKDTSPILSIQGTPDKDPRNRMHARRIAEEVFDDAQCGNYISLPDFLMRVAPNPSMQAFFPF